MPSLRKAGAGGSTVLYRRLQAAPGSSATCAGRGGPAAAAAAPAPRWQGAVPSSLIQEHLRPGGGRPKSSETAPIRADAGRTVGPELRVSASAGDAGTRTRSGAARTRRVIGGDTGRDGRNSGGGLDQSASVPARRRGAKKSVAIARPAALAAHTSARHLSWGGTRQ